MSAYPQFRAAAPRVIRMEMADLYVGDGTTVVQLDAVPCETWIENLRSLVSNSAVLCETRVDVEGAWVHFSGTRKAGGPAATDLLDVISAAGNMAYAAPVTARTDTVLAAAGSCAPPTHAVNN